MYRNFFSWLVKSIFVTLLLFYIAVSLMEEFETGLVSNYLNLNWLLVAVLASAGLTLYFQAVNSEKPTEKNAKPWFLILFSGLATMILLWLAAHDLELVWRILLTVYGGLMTIGILLVLLEE